MSGPYTLIGHFNRVEALLWFFAALGLPFVVRPGSRKQRLSVFAASCGLILFGITDLLEAGRTGDIPPWLWTSKIACAAFLPSCRFTYIGWENFSLNDKWLLFSLFCLAATVVLIALD